MAKKKNKVCDKTCIGCNHYRRLGSNGGELTLSTCCCHYILDEGHMRGCPAGRGCNKKDTSPMERGKPVWQINP